MISISLPISFVFYLLFIDNANFITIWKKKKQQTNSYSLFNLEFYFGFRILAPFNLETKLLTRVYYFNKIFYYYLFDNIFSMGTSVFFRFLSLCLYVLIVITNRLWKELSVFLLNLRQTLWAQQYRVEQPNLFHVFGLYFKLFTSLSKRSILKF